MAWIPIGAWIAAAAVALVVLGYCTYEILWKTKRLRGDIAGLTEAAADLQQLRGQLDEAQRRIAALELG